LEQLRVKCREYGEAAVIDAKWTAIGSWLMKSGYDAPSQLRNPYRLVSAVISMCREQDRARTGYPHWKGGTFRLALDELSPDSREEALRVAEETVADWEKVGRPGLTAKRFKTVQQHIHSAFARKAAGDLITVTQENAA
jgi:hypothetical protein